jgi:hypothetical protein
VAVVVLVAVCLLVAPAAKAAGSSRPALILAASRAPLPKGAPKKAVVQLNSISCASSTSCVAVGIYLKRGPIGLIETLRGTSWKARKGPLPRNASSKAQPNLVAVSCASASFCVAVGSYYEASGTLTSYLDVFSKGHWTARSAPLPAGASKRGGILVDISCPSTRSCEAVGQYSVNPYSTMPYIVSKAGGRWRASAAPLPANASKRTGMFDMTLDDFESITCSSPRACQAIGSYLAKGVDGDVAFFDTLSAGSWTAHATSVPSGGSLKNSRLSTLACPPTGPCEAGGYYYTAQGHKMKGLFESVSVGSEPVASGSPTPAGASGTNPETQVVSVSCAAAGSCVAVERDRSSTGGNETFVVRQSANSWDTQLAPLPAHGTRASGELGSVACRAKSFCVAVGSFNSSRRGRQGLIEAFWSNSWRPREAELPAGAGRASSSLALVSCGSATACYAIGSYKTDGLLETIRRG